VSRSEARETVAVEPRPSVHSRVNLGTVAIVVCLECLVLLYVCKKRKEVEVELVRSV
jgi:hypothetical protein